jgi:hypothetical protein
MDQPVLTLAIDTLQKLNTIDEKQLSTIWNLFTKCKDNIENGRRLENLSWRLWYRSCHPPSAQEPPELSTSPTFSKLLSSTLELPKPEPHQARFFISSTTDSSSIQASSFTFNPSLHHPQESHPQNTTSSDFVKQQELLLSDSLTDHHDPSHPLGGCDMIRHAPIQFTPSDCTDSPDSQPKKPQLITTMTAHPVSQSHAIQKSTKDPCFTLYDSESDSDADSCYSDLSRTSSSSSSCYGESWSYSRTPFFNKQQIVQKPPLNNNQHKSSSTSSSGLKQKKSLLSMQLNNKNPVFSSQRPTQDTDLTPSLKETLLWDRCMPFNTTLEPLKRKQQMNIGGNAWNQPQSELW